MKILDYLTKALRNKELQRLKREISEQNIEIEKLNRLLHAKHSVIDSFDDKKKQMGETERKKYVSDIAAAYVAFFKNQFKEAINAQMQALSEVGRSDEEYKLYRSNINVLRLLEDWMILKTNEHLGDLEEARNRVEETKDFTSNFRETYNVPL